MKPYIFALVLIIASGLTGCAALDWLFGVHEVTQADGTVVIEDSTGRPGDSPAEKAGGALGTFFPWAAAAFGMATSVYQEFRKRKYVRAVTSLVEGIQEVRSAANNDDLILEPDLVRILSTVQDASGTRKTVQKIKAQVESK